MISSLRQSSCITEHPPPPQCVLANPERLRSGRTVIVAKLSKTNLYCKVPEAWLLSAATPILLIKLYRHWFFVLFNITDEKQRNVNWSLARILFECRGKVPPQGVKLCNCQWNVL